MAIPIPEARIRAFENMGFGMFVHWGLYSQLGRGEWVQHIEKIPMESYEKLAATFTADAFDGRRLAQIAKRAGARYIVLTTRHHEGFSLYDTRGLSSFDAPHTPAGRDLVREFVDGCRAEGIVPFFYHTTLDWHHPAFQTDFPAYLQYLRDSIQILCTEYGKIGGFWFDGNWSRPQDDWEEERLYTLIRRYQPDAILVNNTGLDARGQVGNRHIDSVTFEQGRPTPMERDGMPKYIAAEMCHTMNAHWGIGARDLNYKSLPALIETFCACRRVGANYLLNVGPTAQGSVLPLQEALLAGIGDWLSVCGEAVYSGRPCSVRAVGSEKNFALRTADTMYFFIHDLTTTGDSHVIPAGGAPGRKEFCGLDARVTGLRWLDNGEALSFSQEGDRLTMEATAFPYGTSLVVRVAAATLAE